MRLKSTKNYGINHVTILVYGESGIGKTRLSRTAENPVIISTESGLLSLKDYNIPVAEVSEANSIDDVVSWALNSAEGRKFSTIVVDSLSDISEMTLATYKELFKDPRQAYGAMNDTMSGIIRRLRDAERNIYFTAKIKRIEDENTGAVTYRPSIPGQALMNDLPYFFDEVFVMRSKKIGKEKKIYLQTEEDSRYIAKDRSGQLLPQEIPSIRKIFDKIRGGENSTGGKTPHDIFLEENKKEKTKEV